MFLDGLRRQDRLLFDDLTDETVAGTTRSGHPKQRPSKHCCFDGRLPSKQLLSVLLTRWSLPEVQDNHPLRGQDGG